MTHHEQLGIVHHARATESSSYLDHMADIGVWELDLRSNTLTWSDATFRIFAIDPTRFAATYETFLDRVHPEDRLRVDTAYLNHLTTKTPYSISHRLLLPDNRVRHVYEHCHTEFTADGQPLRSVGTVIDITDQQQQREQIQQLQKMSALGQLSCGLLHDMNNFLTVIQSYGDLALGENLSSDVRRYLEKIQLASDKAAGLTHQLLAFSRVESCHERAVRADTLLQSLTPLLRRLVPENIHIELEIADETVPPIFAAASQIEQILMNLVVNARDAIVCSANLYNGSIRIVLDTVSLTDIVHAETLGLETGLYVRLSTVDNGSGIAPEHLDRILDPFYTTRTEGTGMGLAITRDIVKEHQGAIEIASTPEQGSRFSVYLPTGKSAVADENRFQKSSLLPCGTETVLIVEDDADVLDLSETILASLGYTVFTARTPGQARDTIAMTGCQPDILLADVALPEMSGRALGRQLREQQPDLKILYMSGYPKMNADICAEDNLAAFLTKPLRPDSLANSVRQLLDRH